MGNVVDDELSRLDTGPVVQPEDGLKRETVEQPIGDHRRRTGPEFFGRLEDEHDPPTLGTFANQSRGCAHQHGGMTIVAACMHDVGTRGAVAGTGHFLEWQSIDIRSQADGGAWSLAFDDCDDAMTAHLFVYLVDAYLAKHCRDPSSGLPFFS